MEQAFLDFCKAHNVEPTDQGYFFWLGGRHHDEPPVAYGCFGIGGEAIAVLDAIPVGMRPRPVPLYRRPVGQTKPPIPLHVLEYVWDNYAGDSIGFARWVEQYHRQ